MRLSAFLLAWACLLLSHTPSKADILLTGVGSGASGYQGPGDVVSSASGFWGLRAYNAAIAAAETQALVNLRRASDSRTCDVLVSKTGGMGLTSGCSTGGDNGSAVATWCNATTCFVPRFYDQTGNSHDLIQITSALQPSLVFSCLGSLPCLSFNGTSQYLGGSFTAPSPVSASGVIEPTGTTGAGLVFTNLSNANSQWTGHYIQWSTSTKKVSAFSAVANSFSTGSTSAALLNTSAAGSVAATWASSTSRTAYLDSVAATADTSSENPTTQNQIALGASLRIVVDSWFQGDIMEFGVWSSALSGTSQANLCHNQFTYWGTATSC